MNICSYVLYHAILFGTTIKISFGASKKEGWKPSSFDAFISNASVLLVNF